MIRWRDDGDGHWSAWAEGEAWDKTDLEVGSVSRELRTEGSGYAARYWGHVESMHWWTGAGADPAAAGRWPTVELARAALEERHAGPDACE